MSVGKSLRRFLQVLFVMVLFNLDCYNCFQDCEYQYVEQPPTTLHCNPYRRLTTVCRVEGPPQRFSIVWLRSLSKGGGVLDVGRTTERATVHQTNSNYSTEGRQVNFVRVASRLSISPVKEDDVGRYWCQVLLPNGTLFAGKSNILSLNGQEEYNSSVPCRGTNSITQRDCVSTELDNSVMNSTLPPKSTTAWEDLQTILPTTTDQNLELPFKFTTNTTLATPSSTSEILLEYDDSDSSLATIIAYSIPLGVFSLCILTVNLILVTVILRLKYRRSLSQVEPHRGEDIEDKSDVDKTAGDCQESFSDCDDNYMYMYVPQEKRREGRVFELPSDYLSNTQF